MRYTVLKVIYTVSAYMYRRLSAIMFYLHFLKLLDFIYRIQMLDLLSRSDFAYLDCVGFYKPFTFAYFPKIEC